ncbi:Tigger transposable element-derived protein 6 [Folsomia candida]|uniref:Tigger transposable element-derived protein 6 n=1 Tax=Folsomia candida TaxID=158441 RepID=A0A226D6I6_FOLCA|nr:Tigger transposable element-derived protein 6 [Folsomia candida]
MDSINFLSVANALVKIIKNTYSYDETPPNIEEEELAQLLLEKLHDITHEFIFIDENENGDGPSEDDTFQPYTDQEGNYILPSEVSMEYKKRAVEEFERHPGWKFLTFQQNFSKVRQPNYINRWKKQIEMGGTKYELFIEIENYVYQQFKLCREQYLPVHDMDLKKWAILKASEFNGLMFKASHSWLNTFKRRNRIVSRKIQKLVSFRAVTEVEDIQQDAEDFRAQIVPLLKNFAHNKIFNTDQTGFRYEMVSARTLSTQGERYTFGSCSSPKNKCTHSYTVQYVITYAGDILDPVFICLQENDGTFGPRVLDTMFIAPNIYVTCTKSGKLNRSKVEEFLDEIIVNNRNGNLLYIQDMWTGQTDRRLYTSRCTDDLNMDVRFIPEHCTDVCQPLDTYFHRQLKYLARQFYSFESVHAKTPTPQLLTRDGLLKMQSLVHYLLSAPVFRNMIKYCWFSSGIWDGEDRPVFRNVKEVCFNFHNDMKCSSNDCTNMAFISCSWCNSVLCFDEFFYDYHLMYCPAGPYT